MTARRLALATPGQNAAPWDELAAVERALNALVAKPPDATVHEVADELARLENSLAQTRTELEAITHGELIEAHGPGFELVENATMRSDVALLLKRRSTARGPFRAGVVR